MEEPPRQRERGYLVAYAVVVAWVVLMLIGVTVLLWQANDPCNGCTGEACLCNIKNAL